MNIRFTESSQFAELLKAMSPAEMAVAQELVSKLDDDVAQELPLDTVIGNFERNIDAKLAELLRRVRS